MALDPSSRLPAATRLLLFLLVSASSICAPVVPAAARQEASGFVEERLAAFPGAAGERWQLVQRLRPTLQSGLGERTTLVVTVEARLALGRDFSEELRRTLEESEFGPLLDQAGCVWPERGHRRLRVRDDGDYLEVDRLYLDLYRETYDLRIGRQSLHWGSAQFFNPTDPFPEVLLTEPWRPRRGINALRATIPFGVLNDVTAVAAVDDGLERASLATRLRFNLGGVDLALSGAWRGDSEDGLAGLDLRGTTLVGWWIEGALFSGTDPYTELAVGIDYSFPVLERLVVLAQYYRSGSGVTRPDDYLRPAAPGGTILPSCDADPELLFGAGAADTSPFRRFTLARDYLLAGFISNVNAELSANAFLLQNLNDGTALWIPTVSYLATGRLELSLSAQVPFKLWGDGGEFKPRARDLRLEFSSAPGADPLIADLSGLVPSAVVTCWARVSF